ncbi:MAG: TonB-dependent receptor [Deltaproteobacteria bacterium]|nr:TonB-dependent receptor [Deltaproteobacteria bacterium]
MPLNTPLGMGTDISLLPVFPSSIAELYMGGKSHIFGSDAIGGALNLTIDEKIAATELRILHGSFNTYGVGFNLAEDNGSSYLTAGFDLSISEGDFTYMDGNGRDRIAANNSSSIVKAVYKYSSPLSEKFILSSSGFASFADREIMGLMEFPSMTAHEKDLLAAAGVKGTFPDALSNDSLLEGSVFLRGYRFEFRDMSPPMPPLVDTESLTAGILFNLLFEKYFTRDAFSLSVSSMSDFGSMKKYSEPTYHPERTTAALSASYQWYPIGRLLLHPAFRLEVSKEAGIFPLPAIGVSFKLLDSLRIYGNASRAFRLPTFDELYFDAGFVKGNRNLKPEDAISLEAGIAADLGWLEFRAGYFNLFIANMIVFTQKSVYYVQAENSDEAHVSGFESSLLLKPLKNLILSAAYTFRDSESKKTGMELPLMPSHIFSGRLDVDLDLMKIYFEAEGQDRFYLNGFETQFEEGRVIFNAGCSLPLDKRLEIAVHLKNMNNKMDMIDLFQHPLPGFSAFLVANARL